MDKTIHFAITYLLDSNLSTLYTTGPWSNLYMKVIVPGKLSLSINCENFLNLSLFECLTQFYLTNLK